MTDPVVPLVSPESDESWKGWYDHLPRRLYMLRWCLLHGGKFWMDAGPMAKLRGVYWSVVRGYDTEICSNCGRPVRLVFHVPDAIWAEVTGFERFPDGEAAPGVLCPTCVNDRYDRLPNRNFLRWTCSPDDSVMSDSLAAVSFTPEQPDHEFDGRGTPWCLKCGYARPIHGSAAAPVLPTEETK